MKDKTPISLELKRKCAEQYNAGEKMRHIYKETFAPAHTGMGYETFRHKCREWAKKTYPDDETLESGTYRGFTAHGATVQVDRNGGIVQAWIKQHADDDAFAELLNAVRQTKYEKYTANPLCAGDDLLEIPFFDLHFPYDAYLDTFDRTAQVIESHNWDTVVFVIGQDLFHNDDFHGKTVKGTKIDAVDMAAAWKMARGFYCGLIEKALLYGETVKVVFSSGNHSESFEWCFIQMLKEIFPEVVFDDERKPRQIIHWCKVFIGLSHACSLKRQRADDIRSIFTIEYPREFAESTVREIHLGHLHHEITNDIYGVVIRRLASAVPDNEWSVESGYVGAAKRFQLFAYSPDALKAVYYV